MGTDNIEYIIYIDFFTRYIDVSHYRVYDTSFIIHGLCVSIVHVATAGLSDWTEMLKKESMTTAVHRRAMSSSSPPLRLNHGVSWLGW